MSPKLGRPFSENPKNKNLCIRVTEAEKTEIAAFCQKHGVTCLQLIKKGMDALKTK